jgi:hypothetical protein
VLRSETASQLAAVHTAVTSNLVLELASFPRVHAGPVPFADPPSVFDTAWCAAACGDDWKADIDPVTHMRAHVKQHSAAHLTFRGAAPLSRRVHSTGAPPQQLASCRVVIAAYYSGHAFCRMGFVPSHACPCPPS